MFKHKMNVKYLPTPIYGSPYDMLNSDTRILHMLHREWKAKPWKNHISYVSYPEWHHYYRKWQEIGGKGPQINHNANNFYNPAYTFCSLKTYDTFSMLSNTLDIFKHPDIQPRYRWDSLNSVFYIKNLPNAIHYEIKYEGIRFFPGLYINKNFFISSAMKKIFFEIYNNLPFNKEQKSYINTPHLLGVYINNLRQRYVNVAINILVNESLSKIKTLFS